MHGQHTKIILGSFLIAAVMATGCGDSKSTTRYSPVQGSTDSKSTTRYSPVVRSTFIGACEESGGTERYCERVLDCLEGRMDEEEFLQAEAAFAEGTDLAPLAAAVAACASAPTASTDTASLHEP
jgi:hypothetical protein